ncbi:hypothetical protein [Puia sp.]|jgi:hypothetical protein|uniref:hypothetical protein n=1 Tax=Puia sp. TaxID=2045100 RepID=UPI002F4227AC
MKSLALVILMAGLLLACSNKTAPFNNTPNFIASLQIQANDGIRVSTELDAAFNDVDSILADAKSVCGSTLSLFVDSVDSILASTITYNGNTCNALYSRAGTISILSRQGSSWTTPGDSVTVNFANYLVTRLADTKRFRLNGTFIYRNVSGGTLAGLTTGGTSPVVHTIAGVNVNITYDDSTLSRWQFGRQRSYTNSSGLVISTIGLDSAGTIGQVADWGGNRFGNSVVLVPVTPLTISQSCGWQLTGGQATMTNPAGTTTLIFGLDSTGKATGCPVNGNHYYYNLSWTGESENPYSAILSY